MRFAALISLFLVTGHALAQPAPSAPAKAETPTPAVQSDRSTVRFGEKTARPRMPGTVRIANYNAMNFFDSDPVTRTHSEGDPAPIKPAEERAALASAIRAVDADILAMEEVESLAALTAFRDKYLAGMGYEHLQLVESEDPRGIDNAVLSRFPIVETKSYNDRAIGGKHPAMEGGRPNPLAGQDIKFRRTPLRVDVKVPGASENASEVITIIAVHHKSGRGSDYWRIAEARGVVDIAREIEKNDPSARIAVLGDFNGQVTDPNGKIYLDAGFIDAFAGRDAKDPRNISHESGRRIDLILLNKALHDEMVKDSEFIYGMPARPEGADWRNTLPPPGYASDHYPVVVDLKPAARNPTDQNPSK